MNTSRAAHTAAGLAVIARALRTYGAVVDTADPMNPDGCVDVYADRIDAKDVQLLIASLADVSQEDWTGESGMNHRSYSGTLFGRKLNIVTTQD